MARHFDRRMPCSGDRIGPSGLELCSGDLPQHGNTYLMMTKYNASIFYKFN